MRVSHIGIEGMDGDFFMLASELPALRIIGEAEASPS